MVSGLGLGRAADLIEPHQESFFALEVFTEAAAASVYFYFVVCIPVLMSLRACSSFKFVMSGSKTLKAGRKTHRERAQPEKRKHLGLLEKGKDWKKRRDDFHGKEKRLKILAEKARNRNPDEFYHGMISTHTKDGVHQKGQDATPIYTHDELKLMATQDVAYVTHRRSQEAKKLESLQNELHFLGSTSRNTHTVFVETPEQAKNFDPVTYFDTVPELVSRAYNRSRPAELVAHAIQKPKAKQVKQLCKLRDRAYSELGQRMKRLDQLTVAGDKMQTQKNLMGKGSRRKISSSGEIPVYKWKKERKK